MAAHPPHGETNLPSTSTLPEPSNQPQNPAAAAPASVVAPEGGHLDRMQTEVQALQQQAQATQQSLKTLQTHESTGPFDAFVSDLAVVFSSLDSTALGIGSGLVLAGAIVWWYGWHRLRTRWIDAPPATAKEAPIGDHGPLSERNPSLHAPSSTQPPNVAVHADALDWADPMMVSSDTTQSHESGHSPFARHEPNMGFDPEAAASEVTRVRKSLAEKREARAQLQDREDSVSAALDLGLDLDLNVDDIPAATATATATANATETHSVRAWLDSAIASNIFVAPAPVPVPVPVPVPEESVSFSLSYDEPPEIELPLEAEPPSEPEPVLVPESTPMPNMEHESGLTPEPQESAYNGYDFTITLALAQESATLELWDEARDLASEVLESDDPRLVSEALSLLERLNQMELEAPVDTPPGNGVR